MRTIHYTQHMSVNGDGTGEHQFTGKYDVVPIRGLVKPPAGRTFAVSRMIMILEDAAPMRAEHYGTLGAPLANGISLLLETAGPTVQSDLMDDDPVVSNAGWGQICYDVEMKAWGAGNAFLLARFSFNRFGPPIHLHDGDQLAIDFTDDFTGLAAHHFSFQGTLST